MTPLPRKLDQLLLLAAFSALSAVGPGLHHLPVFGLHETHCTDVVAPAGCGHHHSDLGTDLGDGGAKCAVSDASTVDVHDKCAVCDYYSQGQVVAPYVGPSSEPAPTFCSLVREIGPHLPRGLKAHLARGPPLSV